MPGFALRTSKQDALHPIIVAQATRVHPAIHLLELDRSKKAGEEIVTSKTLGRYLEFFSAIFRVFDHGPPCVGSLEKALCAYGASEDRMNAAHSSMVWAKDEAVKIHMCWRFVWNCWKRSRGSRDYVLSKLKSFFNKEGLVSDSEDAWPSYDEAILSTPVHAQTAAVSKRRQLVVSISSDAEEQPRYRPPTFPPSLRKQVLEPELPAASFVDLSTPAPCRPNQPSVHEELSTSSAPTSSVKPSSAAHPAHAGQSEAATSERPRASAKRRVPAAHIIPAPDHVELSPEKADAEGPEAAGPEPKEKKKKKKKQNTKKTKKAKNGKPKGGRGETAANTTPAKKGVRAAEVTPEKESERDPAELQTHLENSDAYLTRLSELRKKLRIKVLTQRHPPPEARYRRLVERGKVIFQVTSRAATETKWTTVGQFMYNRWEDQTAERCAAFLVWVCKLGYARPQLSSIRAELISQPGSLSGAS